jgi:hypothetical protein
MTGSRHELVGGRLDGAEIFSVRPIPPGLQINVVQGDNPRRGERYVAGPDGKLRHAGGSASPPLVAPPAELTEALRPLVAQVGAALRELEAVYCRNNLPVPPLQINDWNLWRR